LGVWLVRLAGFARERDLPPDTCLRVEVERSWWVEVSPLSGTA